jgi:hypothetical protein
MRKSFKDSAITRGEVEIYRLLPDGGRELAYSDHNQIQYVGARQVALAMVDHTKKMPILSRVVASDQDPLVARSRSNPFTPGFNATTGVRDNKADPTFEVTASSVTFSTPTVSQSLVESQMIICQSIVARESTVQANFSLRFYQFGLIMSDSSVATPIDYILAYKYIPGGIAWGIANGLDVIWTLYLGS